MKEIKRLSKILAAKKKILSSLKRRFKPARKASTSSLSKRIRISVEAVFDAPRVKAYMVSGQQVCLPGIGEGSNFGTFPNHYGIDSMLDSTTGWIKVLRTPEDGERPQQGVHYELVEPITWRPSTILFEFPGREAEPAVRTDFAGKYGARSLRVIAGAKVTPKYEDVDEMDLQHIQTPTTPSAASDSSGERA